MSENIPIDIRIIPSENTRYRFRQYPEVGYRKYYGPTSEIDPKGMEMTKILLYSDEPILAKGLESILQQVEGFELLPTCGKIADILERLSQGTPDLC